MLTSSKGAVKKILVPSLLEQLSPKLKISATIYLILIHLEHFVSFVEVRIFGFYFEPKSPLTVIIKKSRGMEFWSKPHYVYFSTWETKLPQDKKDRKSRRDRTLLLIYKL